MCWLSSQWNILSGAPSWEGQPLSPRSMQCRGVSSYTVPQQPQPWGPPRGSHPCPGPWYRGPFYRLGDLNPNNRRAHLKFPRFCFLIERHIDGIEVFEVLCPSTHNVSLYYFVMLHCFTLLRRGMADNHFLKAPRKSFSIAFPNPWLVSVSAITKASKCLAQLLPISCNQSQRCERPDRFLCSAQSLMSTEVQLQSTTLFFKINILIIKMYFND